MPDEEIELDRETEQMLERVRQHYQLATREAAAELLLRRRLRRSARQITGRGRALHEVQGGKRD